MLTDPWMVDPIGRGSAFHFPPLAHDPAAVASATDAIYVSHLHPDHLNPATLAYFSKSTPVYIGEYTSKKFRDQILALGFAVVEVPFQTPIVIEGTGMEICILEHDYQENAAFDSALVVRTPEFTLFENNDCFLRPHKYDWVRERYGVDYAFLGYSASSFFPICFEMEPQEKERLLAAAADRRYRDFLEAASLLRPGLSVPFANGARFLRRNALWKNVSFSSAVEAARRLQAEGLASEVLGPGDRILEDGSIARVAAVLEFDEELRAIEAYAGRVAGWVESVAEPDPPPDARLAERFRDYVLAHWSRWKDELPGIRASVIAYVLHGEIERRFYFDFSRSEAEIFQWGEPARYDMRYTYPAGGLQLLLDGALDLDELHFTDGVSVHQVRYAREFYTMLRSELLGRG